MPNENQTGTQSQPSADVLNSLMNTPEVRAIMIQKLDAERASLTARLGDVDATRASLMAEGDVPTASPAPVRRGPGRPRSNPTNQTKGPKPGAPRRGRPSGKGPDHGGAIKEVLKGKRTGLGAQEIWDALVAAKHKGDRKTINTYISKMTSKGDLHTVGDRGSYKYVLSATNGTKG